MSASSSNAKNGEYYGKAVIITEQTVLLTPTSQQRRVSTVRRTGPMVRAFAITALVTYFALHFTGVIGHHHWGRNRHGVVIDFPPVLNNWFAADYDFKHKKDEVEIFQVHHPVPEYYGEPVASQQFVSHVFKNSHGKPYVGKYTPPADVKFTQVVLTLDAGVYGRQFDRLAHVFIGDVEIWRPSTAEPGGRQVKFAFTKDVSDFYSLFSEPQTVTVLLNNVVDDKYTGEISYKINADFYYVSSEEYTEDSVKESLLTSRNPRSVIPIWPDNHKPGELYKLPNDNIEFNIPALPKNTTRALVNIFASGNADEEFWYSHIFDEYTDYFSSVANDFGGHGPVRTLEVYVDGKYAGDAAPYPVIYTGGMSPALWAPIVHIDAYNVPSYQVDITPFMKRLQQGAKLSVKISNAFDKKTPQVDDDWLVSASLALFQQRTVELEFSEPVLSHRPDRVRIASLSRDKKKLSQIVTFDTKVHNSVQVKTNRGESFKYTWTQKTGHANVQSVKNEGDDQSIAFSVSGKNGASVDGRELDYFHFNYALSLDTKLVGDETNHGYNISIAAAKSTKRPLEKVHTGIAGNTYSRINGHDFLGGKGTTEQRYHSEVRGEKYDRHVRAQNGTLVFDHYLPVDRHTGRDALDPSYDKFEWSLKYTDDQLQAASDEEIEQIVDETIATYMTIPASVVGGETIDQVGETINQVGETPFYVRPVH